MSESTGTGATASSPTPPTPAAMSREIESLQRQLAAMQSAQAAGRITMLLTVLVIFGATALFVFSLRNRIEANFKEPGAIETAARERYEALRPDVERRLRTVLDQAMPIYREELTTRARTVGPELAQAAVDRLEQVPKENADVMLAALREMFDRVEQRVEPDVRKQFPGLSNEQMTKVLADFQNTQLPAQLERVQDHVTTAVDGELVALHGVLDKFESHPDDVRDRDALARSFLLTILDYVKHIIASGGDAELEYRDALMPRGRVTAAAPTTPAAGQ